MLCFFRELLIDLGFEINSPTVVWCDSKSAVDLAYDPVAFKKTKHILRAAEFLRDLVQRDVLVVRHLPGSAMLADILTKAVGRVLFIDLLCLIDTYAASASAPPPADEVMTVRV